LSGVLYAAAETLRVLAILIQPIMPAAAQRLWSDLGQSGAVATRRVPVDIGWGGLVPGASTTKGDSLFPRVDA
jgi:methionyl-tRNA synthetase